eukprot:scaffold5556_cov127-Amphora_coffeaeformis.AAC.1
MVGSHRQLGQKKEELLGLTFLHDVDDGQRVHAKIVKKILDRDAENHKHTHPPDVSKRDVIISLGILDRVVVTIIFGVRSYSLFVSDPSGLKKSLTIRVLRRCSLSPIVLLGTYHLSDGSDIFRPLSSSTDRDIERDKNIKDNETTNDRGCAGRIYSSLTVQVKPHHASSNLAKGLPGTLQAPSLLLQQWSTTFGFFLLFGGTIMGTRAGDCRRLTGPTATTRWS